MQRIKVLHNKAHLKGALKWVLRKFTVQWTSYARYNEVSKTRYQRLLYDDVLQRKFDGWKIDVVLTHVLQHSTDR